MADPFVAYIDEAGDEGFFIVPRPEKNSSEWFLMSAVVVRADKTVMFDNALHELRAIVAKNKRRAGTRNGSVASTSEMPATMIASRSFAHCVVGRLP
jgi:hypothetical protein